ncbi:hypothetical protein F5Y15DRAFT_58224 [Xylariaceae sp. FL0016]|nr:hypothetical protein F5Y15DRAFT_58224 [Xylariaceae sp. FL0016]
MTFLSTLFLLLLALRCAPSVRGDEVACYAPDGVTLANNETVVPCNKLGITQAGVHSSCCRLDGEAEDRDVCTTSGLCLNNGVIIREYCTDKTWTNAACVNVCTDAESGGSANDAVEMTPCGDGSFCCGHQNLTCCGTENAINVPTQATVSMSDDNGSSNNKAYKDATIALAVCFGVVSLAAAAAIAWLFGKNRSLKQELAGKAETPAPTATPMMSQYPASQYPASLDPSTAYAKHESSPYPANVSEMGGHHRYSELDASVVARSEMGSPPPPPESGPASPRTVAESPMYHPSPRG